MKALLNTLFLVLLATLARAQALFVSGPMVGYTELRTARIWTEVSAEVERLRIEYYIPNKEAKQRAYMYTKQYKGLLQEKFNTVLFTLDGLKPGTEYSYTIEATVGKKVRETQHGTFKTQPLLWKENKVPDFSFLTGSCAYLNDKEFDKPGKPYGGDSTIFLRMAEKGADFMLWLGDNWYTRDVDYYSAYGLRYRAHRDRKDPILQPLLKAMQHYAIWDDHDYGPNDNGSSYILKDESRKVFLDYWANPSYGMDGKGIYTHFMYNDVAFFLLDDRTWRSNDALKDSINGQINKEKQMFGREQMQWLKDALLVNRYAPFKIIANGSQMLNPVSPYDCFRHFGTEYEELMSFLKEYKINGVVFLTGDRHRSEIIKVQMPGFYPLYDITVSPLTSRAYSPGGVEVNIPERVPGTLLAEHNYAKVSVSGDKGERILNVQFFDIHNSGRASWKVSEKELTIK
jgi:alkaline phosphatase D